MDVLSVILALVVGVLLGAGGAYYLLRAKLQAMQRKLLKMDQYRKQLEQSRGRLKKQNQQLQEVLINARRDVMARAAAAPDSTMEDQQAAASIFLGIEEMFDADPAVDQDGFAATQISLTGHTR
ncbi:hypothetical protein [Inhella gelatinilytica]|uniref:DUF1043 family protein n=1 Tax=Inhella gelatinilytica TaxID=2795030 RepID=A0A931IY03_9BURK|nr:hypothetical protein [Inhella gelatinilytica]MBH9554244.1 hypothetical protein [Inhella gelatinilytica]